MSGVSDQEGFVRWEAFLKRRPSQPLKISPVDQGAELYCVAPEDKGRTEREAGFSSSYQVPQEVMKPLTLAYH